MYIISAILDISDRVMTCIKICILKKKFNDATEQMSALPTLDGGLVYIPIKKKKKNR